MPSGVAGGMRLRPQQREQVWSAIEAFLAELCTAGTTTHLRICAEAAELLKAEESGAHWFDHVVVDEAQDLHPGQWRVLRAAVLTSPDDLFITGDPHQRIYDSRVSLRALGISVTGRSRRLRINYRSTAEILGWSTGVIDETPIDELSGDGSDSLIVYHSLLHGRRPEVAGYPTESDEVTALVERVHSWLGQGVFSRARSLCAPGSTC